MAKIIDFPTSEPPKISMPIDKDILLKYAWEIDLIKDKSCQESK